MFADFFSVLLFYQSGSSRCLHLSPNVRLQLFARLFLWDCSTCCFSLQAGTSLAGNSSAAWHTANFSTSKGQRWSSTSGAAKTASSWNTVSESMTPFYLKMFLGNAEQPVIIAFIWFAVLIFVAWITMSHLIIHYYTVLRSFGAEILKMTHVNVFFSLSCASSIFSLHIRTSSSLILMAALSRHPHHIYTPLSTSVCLW